MKTRQLSTRLLKYLIITERPCENHWTDWRLYEVAKRLDFYDIQKSMVKS